MIGMKVLIDLIGISFEIFVAMLFYRIFWQLKAVKKITYALGFTIFAIINIFAIQFVHNPILMIIVYIVMIFGLGIYFEKSITSWFLFALVLSALIVISEIMTGIIQTQVLGISIEDIQDWTVAYAIGLVCSKLFALIIVLTIRLFILPKEHVIHNKWFNLVMLFLPIQSLILCFMVLELASVVDKIGVIYISEVAIVISLILVFVTMFILNNQLKSMLYKNKYESAQQRLQIQVKHYNELYEAQNEIRSIRHDIKNKLVAISGLIEKGQIDEALIQIRKDTAIIQTIESVIDTGFPALDATINAYIKKTENLNLKFIHKIIIDPPLLINQIDLAIIISNALDNAMEAVKESIGIDKNILLGITSEADFISVYIKNKATTKIDKHFRTTKKNKSNHGFGINNMKVIVTKYDGDFQINFDEETKEFTIKILLKNQVV